MKQILYSLAAAALASLSFSTASQASEPFVGEIRSFGFNFCPVGWAALDGQLLSVSSNDALFSLLGTIYGGDGRTTFGLPDMRGRVALHQGNGPGLSNRPIGQKSGSEFNTATVTTMATHTHTITGGVSPVVGGSSETPGTHDPAGAYLGTFAAPQTPYAAGVGGGLVDMGDNSVIVDTSTVGLAHQGGSQPINNMAPFEVNNLCIALFGIYPSRN